MSPIRFTSGRRSAIEERFASQLLADALRKQGYEVEKPLGGLETAFRATKRGKGPGPTVAVLAEYDALPNLGHGCGHNLIGASGLAAAIGLGAVHGPDRRHLPDHRHPRRRGRRRQDRN